MQVPIGVLETSEAFRTVVNPEVRNREVCPPVPETLDQAGVAAATVEQLILKLLYTRGEMVGRELAAAVGFKFSLIEPIVENLKRQYLIQVRKSLGMGNISAEHLGGLVLVRQRQADCA
jgi:hypothetical protein